MPLARLMENQFFRPSATGQQAFADDGGFGVANDSILPKVTFPGTTFFTQDMTTKGLTMLHFSGSRDLEPLFHTLMGLLFRHDFSVVFVSVLLEDKPARLKIQISESRAL